MSIEQVTPVEIKTGGFDADATLCNISNTKSGYSDGLSLSAPLALARPAS